MTSGPDQYAAAEQLIAHSRSIGADDLDPAQLAVVTLLEALTRATLAAAAAAALSEGAMPGADYDAWVRVAGGEGALPVWWLDDGAENPGAPPLYTTDIAARAAAVGEYVAANPFSNLDLERDVDWFAPADDDEAEAGDAELAVRERRTGIFVRPIQPQGGA